MSIVDFGMTKSDPSTPLNDIPAWLAVGFPLVTYFVHFVTGAIGNDFYEQYIANEFGITEMATLIILAVAIYAAVSGARLARRLSKPTLSTWLLVYAVGAIYFLGEEASWGQHIFGWQTPEQWGSINGQLETNLHNTEGVVGNLLDKFPRAVLTFSALLFGFAYPLWRMKQNKSIPQSSLMYWLLPTSACIVVGFLVPFASMPGKITDTPPPALDLYYGEIKELMIAQFIMIYAVSILTRLRHAEAEDAA